LTQCGAKRSVSRAALCSKEIGAEDDACYSARHHDAASKFFVQKNFRLDIHHCVFALIQPIKADESDMLLLCDCEEILTSKRIVSETFASKDRQAPEQCMNRPSRQREGMGMRSSIDD